MYIFLTIETASRGASSCRTLSWRACSAAADAASTCFLRACSARAQVRISPMVIVSCGVRAASPLSAATPERMRAAASGRRTLSAALRTESSRATGTRVARSVRSAPREPQAVARARRRPAQRLRVLGMSRSFETMEHIFKGLSLDALRGEGPLVLGELPLPFIAIQRRCPRDRQCLLHQLDRVYKVSAAGIGPGENHEPTCAAARRVQRDRVPNGLDGFARVATRRVRTPGIDTGLKAVQLGDEIVALWCRCRRE